jgi:ubiquinone/menaquinone biosynthesis C-methylase UbiE
MSLGWIDASKFSFNSLLLMDRQLLLQVAGNRNPVFARDLGLALSGNPVVYWYIANKCPECVDYFASLVAGVTGAYTEADIRKSETRVLNELDWAIVYICPDLMEDLPYIKLWDKERLLSITDFKDKIVVDIGSGTGRLAFAAATVAKSVYACEPVDRLREYLWDKRRTLKAENVCVIDGTIQMLPFPNEFFDIVVSGHVMGDQYDDEIREVTRVTKTGGWIIDCPGEDDRKQPNGPWEEMIRHGFSYSWYSSKTGGDVYRYWKVKDDLVGSERNENQS